MVVLLNTPECPDASRCLDAMICGWGRQRAEEDRRNKEEEAKKEKKREEEAKKVGKNLCGRDVGNGNSRNLQDRESANLEVVKVGQFGSCAKIRFLAVTTEYGRWNHIESIWIYKGHTGCLSGWVAQWQAPPDLQYEL